MSTQHADPRNALPQAPAHDPQDAEAVRETVAEWLDHQSRRVASGAYLADLEDGTSGRNPVLDVCFLALQAAGMAYTVAEAYRDEERTDAASELEEEVGDAVRAAREHSDRIGPRVRVGAVVRRDGEVRLPAWFGRSEGIEGASDGELRASAQHFVRLPDPDGDAAPGKGSALAPTYACEGGQRMVDVSGRQYESGTVRSSVLIGSGVQQSDGALSGPGLKAEVFLQGLADGGSGSFPQNYQAVPGIIPLYGWKVRSASLSGDYFVDLQFNPDKSGVSLDAKLVETGATFTTRTATLQSDTISGVGIDGDDYSAEKPTAADAWNNQYTFAIDLQAFAVRTGFTQEGGLICSGGSITVGCYTNDGTGFELRGTTSLSADCFDTPVVRKEVEVGKSGLQQHSGKEFATGIEAETGQGGDYTGVEVTYETATVNTDPATGGGAQVFAAAHAKEDA